MTRRPDLDKEDAASRQLRELGSAIAAEQDARSHADAIEVAHARLFARTPARPRSTMLASFGLAAALLVALVWSARPAREEHAADPSRPEVSGPMALAGDDRVFTFADGSEVRVMAASRARVESTGPASAHLTVLDGEVRARVVHTEATDWVFAAGPFRVRVVGTRLAVQWSEAEGHLVVRVEEGAVVVTGPDVTARVAAGESLELDRAVETHASAVLDDEPSEAPSAPPPSSSAPSPETPLVRHAPVASTVTDVEAAPARDWRSLADAHEYGAAVEAAEQEDLAGARARMSADDLLTFADVARRARRTDVAVDTLEVVRARFPASAESATAAFVLGRIAVDGGHPDEAATRFETYLREAPSGRFARESLGRLIEARQAHGDVDAARAAARDYLARYPEGPHVALARSILP